LVEEAYENAITEERNLLVSDFDFFYDPSSPIGTRISTEREESILRSQE
jgi:hypothetical protein